MGQGQNGNALQGSGRSHEVPGHMRLDEKRFFLSPETEMYLGEKLKTLH